MRNITSTIIHSLWLRQGVRTFTTRMIHSRAALMPVLCIAFVATVSNAQDFGKYREFQFGMNLDSVAKQIQMKNKKNHSIDRKTCPVPKSEARGISSPREGKWNRDRGYADPSGKRFPQSG